MGPAACLNPQVIRSEAKPCVSHLTLFCNICKIGLTSKLGLIGRCVLRLELWDWSIPVFTFILNWVLFDGFLNRGFQTIHRWPRIDDVGEVQSKFFIFMFWEPLDICENHTCCYFQTTAPTLIDQRVLKLNSHIL